MTPSRQSRISALPAHLQEQLRRRLTGRSEQPDSIVPVENRERCPNEVQLFEYVMSTGFDCVKRMCKIPVVL